MDITTQMSERKIVEHVYKLRENPESWKCLWLHFSKLSPKTMNGNWKQLTVNALVEPLESGEVSLYFCRDNEVQVLINSDDVEILCNIIKYLRLAFIEDPLTASMEKEGAATLGDFATLYDIRTQYDEFFEVINRRWTTVKNMMNGTIPISYGTEENPLETSTGDTLEPINPQLFANAIKIRSERPTIQILAVDVDKEGIRMMRKALPGYDIVRAITGKEALTSYEKTAPDLVFMELGLPDITGHQVLEQINAVDSKSFVVILTSHSYPEHVQSAMGNNAKGFIAKPFAFAKVERYIKACEQLKKK